MPAIEIYNGSNDSEKMVTELERRHNVRRVCGLWYWTAINFLPPGMILTRQVEHERLDVTLLTLPQLSPVPACFAKLRDSTLEQDRRRDWYRLRPFCVWILPPFPSTFHGVQSKNAASGQ